MSWTNWFKHDGDKEFTSEKVEKTESGTKEHVMISKDGDRSNHSHVVVHKDESGKATYAHSNGPKNERK